MTPTETLDHIREIHDLAARAGFELEEFGTDRETMAAARLERCAYWANEVRDEIVSHWSEER